MNVRCERKSKIWKKIMEPTSLGMFNLGHLKFYQQLSVSKEEKDPGVRVD
jgi:hypothetical protein